MELVRQSDVLAEEYKRVDGLMWAELREQFSDEFAGKREIGVRSGWEAFWSKPKPRQGIGLLDILLASEALGQRSKDADEDEE